MSKNLFTSESVCAGHPDKICDQISDAILDEVYKKDEFGRVAVETMVTTNKVFVAGEITSDYKVDYEKIIKKQIKRLGYIEPELGFSPASDISINIHEQSSEIAQGVNKKGAGDQGMMFGYACNETKVFMPLPIMIAHNLCELLDKVREKNILKYLRPDGKSQVTVEYKNGKPYRITNVVVAVPHSPKVALNKVKDDIYKKVVSPVLLKYGFEISPKDLIVNGTGVWHIGGPASDTGVTGRKIAVDSYGSYARLGGGAFSGKDPTKVDRSGAYAARFLAKNIVAKGLAQRAEVRLAYFIGARKPVMQDVETFGTEKASQKEIKMYMHKLLDTSVEGIISGLNLRNPIYLKTASYGHFGRNIFPWEKVIG
ncbi:methionine adenosyltransferase [Candidatus Woesebacteria bacterium]|nr:MAG: methionine adenosyltransferase [Candidatus Woesebacteria bacterium]